MTSRDRLNYRIAALLAMLCLGGAACPAQTALLQYNFNAGTGTTAASSGSSTGTGSSLTLDNASGTAANLYSSSGQGLSGQAGDYALDLTAASNMGSLSGAAGAATTATSAIFNGLQSFTISFWYKTDGSEQLGNLARLVTLTDGSTGGFSLWGGIASSTSLLSLQNQADTQTVSSANSASVPYKNTNSWVFTAITINDVAQTASFYAGTSSTTAALVNTISLTSPVLFDSSLKLILGNAGAGASRPLDGYMDDVAIYGSTTDATGALTLAQIQGVQSMNLVPEPPLKALVALAAFFFFGMSCLSRSRMAGN